jgi:hypothetical protein
MMMRNAIWVMSIAAIGFLPFGHLHAEEAVGSGVGVDTTCAQYMDLDRHDAQSAHFAFLSWTQGFMTGFNFARLKAGSKAVDLRAMDQTQLEAVLRRGCAADPKKAFFSVVIEIYQQLAERGKVDL